MKSFCLTATFITLLAAAQPPPGTISPVTTSGADSTNQWLGNVTITNRSGQIHSADQIQSQLQDLHRVVQESLPALTAISETYSNSIAGGSPSVAGGIAGALGTILNRNTNAAGASGQSSGGKTNVLGSILQGVLGATATNAASINAQKLRDLVVLQQHLETIEPILQRLDISTNSS